MISTSDPGTMDSDCVCLSSFFLPLSLDLTSGSVPRLALSRTFPGIYCILFWLQQKWAQGCCGWSTMGVGPRTEAGTSSPYTRKHARMHALSLSVPLFLMLPFSRMPSFNVSWQQTAFASASFLRLKKKEYFSPATDSEIPE